jgi:hypothetical protein
MFLMFIRLLFLIEDYIVYRGTFSFEKTRKIQLENKNEDYGEESEYEIMDEIEDVQDCEDDEKSVSRRIVIPSIRLSRVSLAFVSSMTQ